MYSLFIDTHDKDIVIVLYKDGKVIKEVVKESIQSHSIHVIPIIDSVLKEYKISAKDINEVIVVNGPGSFTGVRIGVTIAKTMAYTLNIPIKEISSLLVSAISVDKNEDKLISICDRNGHFIGIFNKDNELLNQYLYLNNNEYKDYIDVNNYEDIEVLDDIIIDYQKVYDYLKNEKAISPHSVKPLYVKKIEVAND